VLADDHQFHTCIFFEDRFPMKRVLLSVFLLALFTTAASGAKPHFIDTSVVDAAVLLPPPPAIGSSEGVADLNAVLEAQATRTKEQIARGKSEGTLTPEAFQSVLGPEFHAKKLPHVFALLEDAAADAKPNITKAKNYFGRPRPKLADPRVEPVNKGDDEPAYPSGHSTRGMLWARILCEIAPEKKHELLDRGEEIGWDRVLIGAHYPTDVFAGRIFGQALAQAMSENDDFQSRLAVAKEEYQSAAAPRPIAAAAH
jgi:acid phosphatase (class A)